MSHDGSCAVDGVDRGNAAVDRSDATSASEGPRDDGFADNLNSADDDDTEASDVSDDDDERAPESCAHWNAESSIEALERELEEMNEQLSMNALQRKLEEACS